MSTTVRAVALGDGLDYRPLRSLTRYAIWIARLRAVGGITVIAAALIGAWHGYIEEPIPWVIIGAVVLGYNTLVMAAIRAGKVQKADRARDLCLAPALADVAALTAFLYYCGGVENPAIFVYLFPVAVVGILLPARASYFVATVVVVLFGTVAWLQAAIPSLHHSLPFSFPGSHFERWQFVVFVVGALAAAVYLAAYISTTIRSHLREAEDRLVRSRDVLNAVICCMSDPVIFLGPDGRLILKNPAAAHWFGRADATTAQDAAAGHRLPDAVRQYIARARQSSSPLPAETIYIEAPAEGEKPAQRFRALTSSVFDETGDHLGYVIVAENITESWQLEQDLRARNREILAMSEALQRNQREMAQREKMVAIGTMAAGISHEVGNPVACLSVVVQTLRRRNPTPDQVKHLDTLDEQIQRIVKIVQQLVEFARPAPIKWEVVDLDGLIEETLEILRYSRRARQGRIESIRNRELPRVRVVPQQFQQVLINLMMNSLDAVESVESDPLIRVERSVEDGWVHVRVRDWGCGMTEDQLRQAFEPFYTTKPPNKGTGLGLAISYRLVEHQGGRIHIDSAPGKGTTVTVSFPAVSRDGGAGTSKPISQTDARSRMGET